MSGLRVVWFKRDLRLADHRPLQEALRAGGPVVCLHLLEPGLWALPEASGRQFAFLRECLTELDAALRARGGALSVVEGEALETFAALHRRFGLASIHAHEETGLLWTFERDRAVRRWARRAGVAFLETPQHGVIRGLRSRNGWARKWDAFMAEPICPQPERLPPRLQIGGDVTETLSAFAARLAPDPCPERQPGGRGAGLALLDSFLGGRGRPYRRAMSSPLSAAQACSRLSPHLAFGTVSMREAAQATRRALADKRAHGDRDFVASLVSFEGRLHWHCHFIQKLEDAPDLERRNLHSAYDGLRPEAEEGDPRLAAWIDGRTGFPFLDACMRSLAAAGWLNFRMRAMVMAFASYHLWLDWKRPAQALARRFTDFEAGIHYPQSQMQSGVTGVNTARIYNPVKQGHDQDPDGAFVRRWVPELAALPPALRHAPWTAGADRLREYGVVLGQTYPERLIDHEAAARYARERIYGVRRGAAYRAEADAIQDRHGSRKSGIANRGARPRKAQAAQAQLALDFSAPDTERS